MTSLVDSRDELCALLRVMAGDKITITSDISSEPSGPSPFKFLDLPHELRNDIYRELLAFNNADKKPKDLHFEILRTSKQVYHEASDIMGLENQFHMSEFSQCNPRAFYVNRRSQPTMWWMKPHIFNLFISAHLRSARFSGDHEVARKHGFYVLGGSPAIGRPFDPLRYCRSLCFWIHVAYESPMPGTRERQFTTRYWKTLQACFHALASTYRNLRSLNILIVKRGASSSLIVQQLGKALCPLRELPKACKLEICGLPDEESRRVWQLIAEHPIEAATSKGELPSKLDSGLPEAPVEPAVAHMSTFTRRKAREF